MTEDVKEIASAPTSGAKWTLDLFGRTLAMPKRRQLAGIACWLFAGVNLVTILMGVVSYMYDHSPGLYVGFDAWIPYILPINLTAAFVTSAGICVAAILLGFANVARGDINPWPRRLTVICCVVSGVTLFVGNLQMLTGMDAYWIEGFDLPNVAFFWQESDFWQSYTNWHYLAAITFAIAGICAFVYALQLAGWLRSRSMALASALLFAALWAETVGILCLMVNTSRLHSGSPFLPNNVEQMLEKSALIGEMVLSLLVLVFFTVLAVRLGRAARRG